MTEFCSEYLSTSLRTVSPMLLRIRSTHLGTVRETRCLLIQRYFYAIYDYTGKADFSKSYWNSKRKLGVTTHFSEISKLQFGKKCHIAMYFKDF